MGTEKGERGRRARRERKNEKKTVCYHEFSLRISTQPTPEKVCQKNKRARQGNRRNRSSTHPSEARNRRAAGDRVFMLHHEGFDSKGGGFSGSHSVSIVGGGGGGGFDLPPLRSPCCCRACAAVLAVSLNMDGKSFCIQKSAAVMTPQRTIYCGMRTTVRKGDEITERLTDRGQRKAVCRAIRYKLRTLTNERRYFL